MDKYIILIFFLFTFLIPRNFITIKAYETVIDMGTYTISEQVMTRVKVFVDADKVNFIKSTGKYVYTREIKNSFLGIPLPSTFEYYFYEDKYVDVVVKQRQLYNDIDTLIFMVTELEEIAKVCGSSDVKNSVLGYIRGINTEYYSNYGQNDLLPKWEIIAGKVDLNFVKYVDQVDGTGVEFAEYFAQFLPYKDELGINNVQIPDGLNDYFNIEYGDDISTFYTARGKYGQVLLTDPFNPLEPSGIDVTHMFASMDGIFETTGSVVEIISLGLDDHQKDLSSWLGDLHTFTKTLYDLDIEISNLDKNINVGGFYTNTNIDFCIWVNVGDCTFPEEDLLADIDAMNLMKFFGDLGENKISNSLSAYYNIIRGDNSQFPNRYKMFIESVTFEIEFIPFNGESNISKFKKEVFYSLNTKEVSNKLENYERFSPYLYEGFALLRGNYFPLLGEYPDLEYRAYAAELFADYILYMSSVPYTYS